MDRKKVKYLIIGFIILFMLIIGLSVLFFTRKKIFKKEIGDIKKSIEKTINLIKEWE